MFQIESHHKKLIINLINLLSPIPFIALLSFVSCNTLEGHRGISKDINESKKRDVFIASFTVTQNPYSINDTIKLYVKSAWLERKWHYTQKLGESESDEGYRIIIESEPQSLRNYYATWTIGTEYTRHFEINPNYNILHAELDSIPKGKIIFKVQKGSNLKSDNNKEIIGELILVEKF